MRNLAGFEGEVVPISSSRDEVGGRPAFKRAARRARRRRPRGGRRAGEGDPRRRRGRGRGAGPARSSSSRAASPRRARRGPSCRSASSRRPAPGGVRIVGPNCLGVQNCATGAQRVDGRRHARRRAAGSRSRRSRAPTAWPSTCSASSSGWASRRSTPPATRPTSPTPSCCAISAPTTTPRVACFFVESLSDARGFVDAARAVTARKPVLVTKTGRTAAGRARRALAHRRARRRRGDLARRARAGGRVVVADSGLEMMDAARALDWQPVPRGPRVGIVTNSGGTGVELTDLLSEQGLEVPELSDDLQRELAEALPPFGSARNPVDVTTAWARFAELYPLAIDRLARSGEVDVVVPVLLQRSAMDADVVAAVRDAAARLRDDAVDVAVYVCWVAPASARANADLLHDGAHPDVRLAAAHGPRRRARAPPRRREPPRARGRARAAPPPARAARVPGAPGPLGAERRGAARARASASPCPSRRCARTRTPPSPRRGASASPSPRSSRAGATSTSPTPAACASTSRDAAAVRGGRGGAARARRRTRACSSSRWPPGPRSSSARLRDPALGAGRHGRLRRRARRGPARRRVRARARHRGRGARGDRSRCAASSC